MRRECGTRETIRLPDRAREGTVETQEGRMNTATPICRMINPLAIAAAFGRADAVVLRTRAESTRGPEEHTSRVRCRMPPTPLMWPPSSGRQFFSDVDLRTLIDSALANNQELNIRTPGDRPSPRTRYARAKANTCPSWTSVQRPMWRRWASSPATVPWKSNLHVQRRRGLPGAVTQLHDRCAHALGTGHLEEAAERQEGRRRCATWAVWKAGISW